jgi:hypothetical protein
MSKSSDWQLRLGPFRFRIAVRTLGLKDASEPPTAGRLPAAPGALEVGHIRMLDDAAPPDDEPPKDPA